MPDNPQPCPPAEFALPDHRVIELRGPDATRYAQAQLMSDVAALASGHWHWSGWLTPKGRVIALFAVVKFSDERLWLLLPDAAPAPLADALRRYVFRSKLVIAVRDDLHVRGSFAAPHQASGAVIAGDADTTVELDLSAADGARRVFIGLDVAGSSGPDATHWAAFDLAHGLPRLPDSQAENWTPQQLSLERLRAFSVKKGCYPGQEIVARTHFLGKAKRGLALVEADQALAVGAQLHAAGSDSMLGTVISVASAAEDSHLALAVLPLGRDAGALVVDGLTVSEVALREGLAR